LKTIFSKDNDPSRGTPVEPTLADIPLQTPVVLVAIGGERALRRRLMELGLVPGTTVTVVRVAPLGDPLELTARGCNLSIRHAEARQIRVKAP
jgi:ferrous iron transport protein A